MPREARERQGNFYEDHPNVHRTLPAICVDVHMISCGSADYSDDGKQYEYDKETLQIALDNWQESIPSNKMFDDAVKNLIEVTLKESRGEK